MVVEGEARRMLERINSGAIRHAAEVAIAAGYAGDPFLSVH